jgi:hypothetical protein
MAALQLQGRCPHASLASPGRRTNSSPPCEPHRVDPSRGSKRVPTSRGLSARTEAETCRSPSARSNVGVGAVAVMMPPTGPEICRERVGRRASGPGARDVTGLPLGSSLSFVTRKILCAADGCLPHREEASGSVQLGRCRFARRLGADATPAARSLLACVARQCLQRLTGRRRVARRPTLFPDHPRARYVRAHPSVSTDYTNDRGAARRLATGPDSHW